MRATRRGALILLMLAGLGCNGDRDQARLVLTGSSTVAPLASEIAKRFEASHPGVRVDVQMGGSSRGLADARKGLADIGMMSRALTAQEGDVQGHVIAQDGLSMIVHQDNPVKALTDPQIVQLYTGAVRDWGALGGSGPVTVVNKAAGRSTLEVFLKHFGLKDSAIKPDVVIGDNEQGIRTVAGNPRAVGYVSIGAAEQAVRAGVPIRALAIDGLSRPLVLVTRATPAGLAGEFIAFARSPAVHDLVQQQFFVPIPN